MTKHQKSQHDRKLAVEQLRQLGDAYKTCVDSMAWLPLSYRSGIWEEIDGQVEHVDRLREVDAEAHGLVNGEAQA